MRRLFTVCFLIGLIGCSSVAPHVANVATECIGAVTPMLVADVVSALSDGDYEQALVKVGNGVAPCILVSAVKEVVSVAQGAKVEPSPNALAVAINGRAWLSRHDK